MPTPAVSPGLMTPAELLVTRAAGRAGRTALRAGAPLANRPDGVFSYPQLAVTAQAAAAGLASRGLRPRDVVGIYLPDAASYLIATLAVRTASGVPCPVSAGLTIAEMAGQMAESGARMLITSPPLTTAALAMADRSWVRQIFSFADSAGMTTLGALLDLGSLAPIPLRPDDLAMLPFRRGPDGRLRPAPATQRELARKLAALAAFEPDDIVLATPPTGDGMAYTVALDGALLAGATLVASPVRELAAAASRQHGTVAMIPGDADISVPPGIRPLPIR